MNNRVAEALDIVVRAARLGEYDCNVIGMAAEIIAEDEFKMEKSSRGSRDVDGTWYLNGLKQKVQVKAWSEARVKRYRNGTFLTLREDALPDVLLCILVYCSKPGYEIIYNGPPAEKGKVEKNRPVRVIRFDHMKSREEIASILRDLGLDISIRTVRPKVTRTPTPRIETRTEKQCSVCGAVFSIEEFSYGNRTTNSYCKECCKANSSALARGGSDAARRFREQKRAIWKTS